MTDGWYMIKTILDTPLSVLVQKGRLTVGQKLFISGAELTGSQEASSPLEAGALVFYSTLTWSYLEMIQHTLRLDEEVRGVLVIGSGNDKICPKQLLKILCSV